MSLPRIKSWSPEEVLTANDLNGEFDNILGNPISLISPFTGDVDANEHTITDAVLVNPPKTFTANDSTPSVAGGRIFKTANSAPTTITMFDSGTNGQEIVVVINDANTTIDFTGTNLKGNAGADWTPTTNDHMLCVFTGTNWHCRISDNTA